VVSLRSPRDARKAGVAHIPQDLSIVPTRSVLENVYLGSVSLWDWLTRRRVRMALAELMRQAEFHLNPDQAVGTLGLADQQKVEILRALARDASLIVMDEPTASLSPHEARGLHRLVRRLSERGATIIYVSHFLDEVLALADTITVLKDGSVVRT